MSTLHTDANGIVVDHGGKMWYQGEFYVYQIWDGENPDDWVNQVDLWYVTDDVTQGMDPAHGFWLPTNWEVLI